MTRRVVPILAAAGLALGTTLTAVLAEPGAASQDKFAGATYVGADSCKKCHFGQHRTWKAMKHASAWENLPETYHDPAQVDEKGRACISCHVTGWDDAEHGGFADPETSAHLLGVQCEACHGPGSKHVELGQQMLKEKRKELEPGEESFMDLHTTKCSECHNPHVSHAKYAEG